MHVLRLHAGQMSQNPWRLGSGLCVLTSPAGDSDEYSGLKATGLVTILSPHCSSTHQIRKLSVPQIIHLEKWFLTKLL